MTDRNTHSQRTAAARAGFSERTARRFDADSTLPSQRKPKRARTVTDPLDGVWETLLLPILKQDSSVQAITLLRHLQQQCPEDFRDDRIRRTLERRVRDWRALHAPRKISYSAKSQSLDICANQTSLMLLSWASPLE